MRRFRKTYEVPRKKWEHERMEREAQIIKSYGLKNKREVWKAESILRKYRRQARDLLARPSEQKEKELLGCLQRLGVIGKDATLDSVLELTVENFLERRLQTLVHRRGLASTIDQARQFIVHGHIAIGDRRVTVPGYLVSVDEENEIRYWDGSPLKDELHPLRRKG